MNKHALKTILIAGAGIFALLTVILYFASIKEYNGQQIANVQGTVFCAACAVICAINVIGFIILYFIETYVCCSTSVSGKPGIRTEDGGVIASPSSYWTCPSCKTRNPMSKIECKECGKIR